MKRDKELLREILFAVEDRKPGADSEPVDISGRSLEEVSGHVQLLVDAGFLKATMVPGTEDETYWFVERMTYGGHEFLDTVRSPEVWRRTKEAAGKIGGVSISILAEIAKATAKSLVKEHLGLDLG